MPVGPQPVFRSHVSDMALQVFLIHAPVYTCVMCTAVPVGSHGAVCGEQSVVLRVLECLSHPGSGLCFCYYARIFRECLNVDSSQEPQGSSVEGHVHLAPASSTPRSRLQHPERPCVWTCVQRVCGPHLHLVAGAGHCFCVMGVGPPVRVPVNGTVVHPCCRRVHVCLGQRSRSIVFCREGGACVLRGLRSAVTAGTSLIPKT